MNRVYTPSTHHPLRSPPPPMLPSGPTCHTVTHITVLTVSSIAACTTQQVLCPEQSTAQTSMNTSGAQTCHTTASHLIEHTHTHGAILNQHRNRRKCSPSHTEWFCQRLGTRHSSDCAKNYTYDIHIAFGLYRESNMKQATQLLSQSIMFQIKKVTHNTKQPNTVHALCRLTHCSTYIAEGTVE